LKTNTQEYHQNHHNQRQNQECQQATDEQSGERRILPFNSQRRQKRFQQLNGVFAKLIELELYLTARAAEIMMSNKNLAGSTNERPTAEASAASITIRVIFTGAIDHILRLANVEILEEMKQKVKQIACDWRRRSASRVLV
jgi:hypothetical protein